MAEGWDRKSKVIGILGLLALVFALVGVLSGTMSGLTVGADSFQEFIDNGTVAALIAVSAVMTLVFGLGYGWKHTNEENLMGCIFALALVIGGLVGLVLSFYSALGLKWAPIYSGFLIIFILAAAIATVSDALSPRRWPAVVDVILLLVMVIGLVDKSALQDVLVPLAAAALVGFAGAMCFLPLEAEKAPAAAEPVEKAVYRRKEKKASPKFYEEGVKTDGKAGKEVAVPEVKEPVSPAPAAAAPAAEPVPKAEPADPAPAKEEREASVSPAADVPVADEPKKAIPTLPKMMSSRQAAAAARNVKGTMYESQDAARYKASEEKEAAPVREEPVPKAEPVQEAIPVSVEQPAPVTEPQDAVQETSAAEPAAAQAEAAPAPAEVPAVAEQPEEPETEEAEESEPVSPAEETEAPAEDLPAEEPSEEAADSDADDYDEADLAELGLVPDTPETLVRRACWNKGLRCRKDYGPSRIPVAFVKGKVAVFIDEGAAAGDDEALKAEGWTVMHFPVEEITDGQTQAEAVAAAVKENVRSKKASKRRAKR